MQSAEQNVSQPGPPYKRKKNLIDPKLQLSITAQLFLVAAAGLLIQFAYFGFTLSGLAKGLPTGGSDFLDSAYPGLVSGLLVSLLALAPLMVVVGIRVTFRVAGPVYRFKRFLEAVEAGEQIDECRIRSDDQLHDLCDLINRATARERVEASRRSEIAATRDAA